MLISRSCAWLMHIFLPPKEVQGKVRQSQGRTAANNFALARKLILGSMGTPLGGGVLSPKSYVDVPAGPRKSDYLYTNFLPNFPPISIPFSKEKHPIWIKLGAFYNNLLKIHPISVIWAPSSLMKTPRSLYQISRKSAPKGRHIYVYHVNVRTPPGPPLTT